MYKAYTVGGVPVSVWGDHDQKTIDQLHNCLGDRSVLAATQQPDGQFAYSQPVGSSIAHVGTISVSGVGYDIGCGVMATKLDVPIGYVMANRTEIAEKISQQISFGMGRANASRVDHALFDDPLWRENEYLRQIKQHAENQLGTVGTGNHFVDVSVGQDGSVWIVVHFGSRGFGHKSATGYMNLHNGLGFFDKPKGEDRMAKPTLFEENSDLGEQYIGVMNLAGKYAYAGRGWVTAQVRDIIGGQVLDVVHNHHNFAFREEHMGFETWTVRKGATPNRPGQRGVVGGSMGDFTAIIHGLDTEENRLALYSTVHGAGRTMSRNQAKKTFTQDQWKAALAEWDVHLVGGDLDESPNAYRKLDTVLGYLGETVAVEQLLKPVIVLMAGKGVEDDSKD